MRAKVCQHCHRGYTQADVVEMLEAMGFGPQGSLVDEDYLVLIHGLCPECWPGF